MEPAIGNAFFKREFEAEERAGFPRLSRIPDTSVRRFLHYFRSLPQSDAELLRRAIAKRATGFFLPMGNPIDHTNAESVALEQKARALAQLAD